ncbi:MAG: OST-HTH/LOTUS domain-containing protein [Bacteroidales bacterium]|nr:OST-HTH/LOTUS domain-containing protein [Bacteroidales bacterium]
MEKSELESIIIEAVDKCADDQGWANLAKMGAFIRKKGVQYGRLSRLLREYEHIVEIRIDESIQPPVAYARLAQNS